MIGLGKGGTREVNDYHLSRFACYLIAQNGDPRIPEIANAQEYFAIQTRRQEPSDALAADIARLELRKQASEEFRALSGAAREAISGTTPPYFSCSLFCEATTDDFTMCPSATTAAAVSSQLVSIPSIFIEPSFILQS